MPNNQFFRRMLKIPTFILGGLLILTGLAGYLFQDAGLSLKLTGPLADDAEFTLSDGNDSVVVDLGFPSSKSAGEYAFLDGTSFKPKSCKGPFTGELRRGTRIHCV